MAGVPGAKVCVGDRRILGSLRFVMYLARSRGNDCSAQAMQRGGLNLMRGKGFAVFHPTHARCVGSRVGWALAHRGGSVMGVGGLKPTLRCCVREQAARWAERSAWKRLRRFPPYACALSAEGAEWRRVDNALLVHRCESTGRLYGWRNALGLRASNRDAAPERSYLRTTFAHLATKQTSPCCSAVSKT